MTRFTLRKTMFSMRRFAWQVTLLLIVISLPARSGDGLTAPSTESNPALSCLGEQICADHAPTFPGRARELADQVLAQVYALPDEEKRYFLEQRRDAVGFAIFPNVQRSGFMMATLYGKGILAYRDETGGWSLPILLTIQGQSVGPQFGAQTSSIIFMFKTVCGLKDFLTGHHHIDIGPTGTTIEHVDHDMDPLDITVHAFDRGGMLFGQSLDTYSIHIDEEANAALYGVQLKPGCIVEGTRSGFKAPWMMQFFENMKLRPGEARRVLELE